MNDEDSTELARLRFGAFDWRHPAWTDNYYPDDLPADWQLGYYANELSAVLLEPAAWLQADASELVQWADDLPPGFRFYLMGDAGADAAPQLELARALGGRLGALLWPCAPVPDGALEPVAGLPDRIRGWGGGDGLHAVALDVTDLDLRAQRGLLEQLAPRLRQDGDVGIFVQDRDATPQTVRELQTVADLMGLA
jgi:hypothetical protein